MHAPPPSYYRPGNTIIQLVVVQVSNPPYIPTGELAGLEPEVAWHEDPGALDGGADGLDIVRPLLTHRYHAKLGADPAA